MKVRYAVGAALVGYFAGSVSFGRLVGRIAAPEEDVTQTTLELPGGATLEFEGVSATSIAAGKPGATRSSVPGVRFALNTTSHEVRQPLSAILATTEVLLRDPHHQAQVAAHQL